MPPGVIVNSTVHLKRSVLSTPLSGTYGAIETTAMIITPPSSFTYLYTLFYCGGVVSATVTDATCVVASVVQQQTTTAAAAVFACDTTKDSYKRPTAAAATATTSRADKCYKFVEKILNR